MTTATPDRKGAPLEFELTLENLTYLATAVHEHMPDGMQPAVRQRYKKHKCMFKDTPHVFEVPKTGRPSFAKCVYINVDGKRKLRTKTINFSQSDIEVGRDCEIKRDIALELEEFYRNNNAPEVIAVDEGDAHDDGDEQHREMEDDE